MIIRDMLIPVKLPSRLRFGREAEHFESVTMFPSYSNLKLCYLCWKETRHASFALFISTPGLCEMLILTFLTILCRV